MCQRTCQGARSRCVAFPYRYGWGAGTNGQLCRSSGYGSMTNSLQAGPVDSKVRFSHGCGSEDYTLLLSQGAKSLKCAPMTHMHIVAHRPPHSTFAQLRLHITAIPAIPAAGDVYMCGEKNRYQNGGVPFPAGGAHNVFRLLQGQSVVRLACGESHIIVATADGRAYVSAMSWVM